MSTGDFRVADISLADFGRKEIDLAEHEVSVAIHTAPHIYLTIQPLNRCLVSWRAEKSMALSYSRVPGYLDHCT
jgi:S-adenosylhomocysteine hydrolase